MASPSPASTAPLSPRLEALARDFEQSVQEVRRLLAEKPEDALRKRPSAASWSALECVVHLNLSTQAMLPGIEQAVAAAGPASPANQAPRADFTGRLLAWSLEPPARLKMKTTRIAEPLEAGSPQLVSEEFARQHRQLLELLHAAAGKRIDQQKMKSPFANVRYNAYSGFRIVAAHDRRHLWQARKALGVAAG